MGGAINEQLSMDSEQITLVTDKVEDINSELALAAKQLRGYVRHMATDRIIRALIILILLGTIVVLIVGIWRQVNRNNTSPTALPSS